MSGCSMSKWREERFKKLEVEAEKIKQGLVGKTIQDVKITVSQYPGQFECIELTFTDGKTISVGSGGVCGCEGSDGIGYGISID